MRDVTIVFLVRKKNSEVLLAMKKRGFGEGLWNGYGGKFEPEKDKGLVSSAIRECEEEAEVKIKSPRKVAEIDFFFVNKSEWDQKAHVFLVEKWEGEPVETEEMKPKWFKAEEIPYEKMWVDDQIWLPRILKGESLKMEFVFKGDKEIVSQKIKKASYK
jgi:8-oxo-dGTP pyrophosphatase MutT (NUDIX family)